MGSRVLYLALAVVLFSSMAFAGPQIVINDPLCNGTEIPLGPSGTFSFTYTGQSSLTFCNTTSNTFTSLNFTITAPTNFDLNGFYCGSPDDTTTAAFDYCLVLDPKHAAPAGQNAQLYGNTPPPFAGLGGNPNELVVHQFVTSYPLPVAGPNHDTPSSFYQNDQCFFGCPTVGSDMTDQAHLSFDLLQDPGGLRAALCQAQLIPALPCGLLANHQFTMTLGCDEANITGNHPCTPLPPGSTISLQAFNGPDQVTFPTTVPEPATLTLLATAGIPALLRRRKKK